jgi:hypothetical protein
VSVTLGSIEKRWRAITAVGAIIVSTAAAIFRPPPVGEPQSFVALGTFLSAVVAGLIYVAMKRCASANHLPWWIAAALVGAGGAVWSHNFYTSLLDSRVAVYEGQQFVVGDEYTVEGAAWAARHGHEQNNLLFDAGGVVTRIWSPESVGRVKARMRLSYYAVFPLIALGLLSTVQAVYCSGRRRGSKK